MLRLDRGTDSLIDTPGLAELVAELRNDVADRPTRDEVEAAVAAAQVTPVGTHLMEPGGWCRTCGGAHSHTEWARLHDQESETCS